MTAKRFMLDDAGELIDLNNHQFIDYGDECCNLLNELAEENTHIKNTIKELYQTERTQIGKNTLKQLIEAIQ